MILKDREGRSRQRHAAAIHSEMGDRGSLAEKHETV
jgi:hypothetical protein